MNALTSVTDVIKLIGRKAQYKGPLRIEVSDMPILVANARGVALVQQSQMQEERSLHDAFPFVPGSFMKRLRSYYGDDMQLCRILSQRCVVEWSGWRGLTNEFDYTNRDEDLDQELAALCVITLIRETLQGIHIEAKTDTLRREELGKLGRRIGQGHSFPPLNAPLANSILQLLAHHRRVPPA